MTANNSRKPTHELRTTSKGYVNIVRLSDGRNVAGFWGVNAQARALAWADTCGWTLSQVAA